MRRSPLSRGRGAFCALLVWITVAGSGGCARQEAPEEELLVFAAASLRDVLTELKEPFEESSGLALRFNFAGSNTLALQIEASGRGDVFLSADEAWMDFLEKAGQVAPETRRTFLSNRLVIVARAESPWQLESPRSLPRLPFRGLALADPAAVPAGRYARRYLEGLPASLSEGGAEGAGSSVWQAVARRVVPALDVRGALALVEADDQILGVVYRSDAATSGKVRVLFEAPAAEGPEIRYSGAVVKGSPRALQALRFLDFLGEKAAVAAFLRHGFEPTTGSASEPGNG